MERCVILCLAFGLRQIFGVCSTMETETMFENVKVLRAGHLWSSEKGEKAWWTLNYIQARGGSKREDLLYPIVQDAVRTALVCARNSIPRENVPLI